MNLSKYKFIDFQGKRFGSWLVVGDSFLRERKNIFVDCECDCGNRKPVNIYQLARGESKSCGCLRKTFFNDSRICSRCKVKKPLSEFAKDKSQKCGLCCYCRGCLSDKQKEIRTRAKDAGHGRELDEGYKRYQRDYSLKRRYGISPDEYERMAASQEYRCAICGKDNKSKAHKSKLVVDHDHKNGVVRSLLCHGCNIALGVMKDDPYRLEKAAAYLRSHNGADE